MRLEATRQPAVPARPARPGLHLIGDLHGCRCNRPALTDAGWLRQHCLMLVREAGLTPVGELFHAFDGGGGVTGTVVLSESHLCLHTWPEEQYVTLDVFVCNYSADNRDKARALFDRLVGLFDPEHPRTFALDRD